MNVTKKEAEEFKEALELLEDEGVEISFIREVFNNFLLTKSLQSSTISSLEKFGY